eukprot:UC1_evm1s1746
MARHDNIVRLLLVGTTIVLMFILILTFYQGSSNIGSITSLPKQQQLFEGHQIGGRDPLYAIMEKDRKARPLPSLAVRGGVGGIGASSASASMAEAELNRYEEKNKELQSDLERLTSHLRQVEAERDALKAITKHENEKNKAASAAAAAAAAAPTLPPPSPPQQALSALSKKLHLREFNLSPKNREEKHQKVGDATTDTQHRLAVSILYS